MASRPLPGARPLIGVPAQTLQVIDGIPAGLPRSWVMNQRYLTALAQVGAAPVLLPLLDDDPAALDAIHDRLDGLFIAGGVDLDPASYGEPKHPQTGNTDAARDAVELALARRALEEGMPVLGVCRGMQILNVVRGGTLVQDTTQLRPGPIRHDWFPTDGHARDFLAHAVTAVPGSRVAGIFGTGEFLVNSMHHQGVAELGEGLVATAHAGDGLIEALEAPGEAWVVGVQWHPEMLVDRDPATRRLFGAFVTAAAAFSERRAFAGRLPA